MNYKLLLMRTKQLIKSGQPTSADDAYRILITARMAVISAIESKLIIYDKVNMWDRALKKLDKSDGINVKHFNPYNKDANHLNGGCFFICNFSRVMYNRVCSCCSLFYFKGVAKCCA